MIILAFNTLLATLTVLGMPSSPDMPKLASVGIVCLVFLPILLIFWFAGWIVDILTPKAAEALPDTGFKPDDLQAIAFSAVGVFILYTAARETAGLLSVAPRMSVNDGAYITSNALRVLVAWLFGLYLLVGAPAIRRGSAGFAVLEAASNSAVSPSKGLHATTHPGS